MFIRYIYYRAVLGTDLGNRESMGVDISSARTILSPTLAGQSTTGLEDISRQAEFSNRRECFWLSGNAGFFSLPVR